MLSFEEKLYFCLLHRIYISSDSIILRFKIHFNSISCKFFYKYVFMYICVVCVICIYVYAYKYVVAKVKVEYLFLSCFLSHFWETGSLSEPGKFSLK